MGRERENPKFIERTGDWENSARCVYFKYMNVKDDFWYWSEIINSELNFKKRIHMPFKEQIETDSLGFVKLRDVNRIVDWEHWDLPAIYDTTIPVDSNKYEQLLMFSHTVSSLQNKAREQRYQKRLSNMEKRTIIMLIVTGGGTMVILLIAMFTMFSF